MLGEAWAYTNDACRHVWCGVLLEGTPEEDETVRRLKDAYDRLQEVFESVGDLL